MSGAGLVIVGGSYAALQIAASAREAGYSEPIRLISDEPCLPYQRPPLSKGFLAGKVDTAALPLRVDAFYRENAIEPILGTRVEAIDPSGKVVHTKDGGCIAYDRLALAVGARPRSLPAPGAELAGVVVLRSLADAARLRERLPDVSAAVIVGGGFIGLEVASVLVSLGKQVTVVEAADRLLARAASAPLAEFVADAHRCHGVRLALRTTVTEIRGERGHVKSVVLNDGSVYPADLVVIGIGITPNVELAAAAGLPCANGITVDSVTRTADPSIVAAGDCTFHPSAFGGGLLRLESVQNALDQAKTAGATIAGALKPYDAVPWFWSDQYDLKLQMVGLSGGHDHAVRRGSLGDGRFSLFYFRAGSLIAVDSVNRPADHMLARKLLASRARITPDQAADESFDLRSALTQ